MASLPVIAALERTFGINQDVADVLRACHWLLGTLGDFPRAGHQTRHSCRGQSIRRSGCSISCSGEVVFAFGLGEAVDDAAD
jgi:hypothetical protein